MVLQNQGLQRNVFLVGMSSVKWLLSSHSPGKFPNRLRVVNQSRRSSECTGHKWCTCGKEQTNNVYVYVYVRVLINAHSASSREGKMYTR